MNSSTPFPSAVESILTNLIGLSNGIDDSNVHLIFSNILEESVRSAGRLMSPGDLVNFAQHLNNIQLDLFRRFDFFKEDWRNSLERLRPDGYERKESWMRTKQANITASSSAKSNPTSNVVNPMTESPLVDSPYTWIDTSSPQPIKPGQYEIVVVEESGSQPQENSVPCRQFEPPKPRFQSSLSQEKNRIPLVTGFDDSFQNSLEQPKRIPSSQGQESVAIKRKNTTDKYEGKCKQNSANTQGNIFDFLNISRDTEYDQDLQFFSGNRSVTNSAGVFKQPQQQVGPRKRGRKPKATVQVEKVKRPRGRPPKNAVQNEKFQKVIDSVIQHYAGKD